MFPFSFPLSPVSRRIRRSLPSVSEIGDIWRWFDRSLHPDWIGCGRLSDLNNLTAAPHRSTASLPQHNQLPPNPATKINFPPSRLVLVPSHHRHRSTSRSKPNRISSNIGVSGDSRRRAPGISGWISVQILDNLKASQRPARIILFTSESTFAYSRSGTVFGSHKQAVFHFPHSIPHTTSITRLTLTVLHRYAQRRARCI